MAPSRPSARMIDPVAAASLDNWSAIFALVVVNRAAGEASKSLATLAQANDQLAADGQPRGERLAELSQLLTVGSVKPFKGFTSLLRCLR
jgi:hypothetical protein